jgi:hypothetical protein
MWTKTYIKAPKAHKNITKKKKGKKSEKKREKTLIFCLCNMYDVCFLFKKRRRNRHVIDIYIYIYTQLQESLDYY